MQTSLISDIIRLRFLVGYLGEKNQYNWWPSEFITPNSAAFLAPVFSKTASLAQYHGVTEASRRVHDEHIGVGRVFHLFRLPENLEQALFDQLQDLTIATNALKELSSQDVALSALQTLAGGSSPAQEGPIKIGEADDLAGDDWPSLAARHYHAAFTANLYSYPYFVAQA